VGKTNNFTNIPCTVGEINNFTKLVLCSIFPAKMRNITKDGADEETNKIN
jgi:hypothetical protein